jgi:hypothetical protein
MARRLGLVILALPLLQASGCAICCAPYDCNYQYCGGRWVRNVPDSGRVGSAFEPAGTRVEGEPAVEAAAAPTPAQPGAAYGNMPSVLPRASGNMYLPGN